jgi:hypothetical protein
MDKQALRALLGDFLGKAAPIPMGISSVSDMDELMRLWKENAKNPETRKAIETRMAEVIGNLTIDNVDEFPEWIKTIVGDEMLLPSKKLRDLFRKKANKIYVRLSKDQDTSQT